MNHPSYEIIPASTFSNGVIAKLRLERDDLRRRISADEREANRLRRAAKSEWHEVNRAALLGKAATCEARAEEANLRIAEINRYINANY
jgi:hypothetical protein